MRNYIPEWKKGKLIRMNSLSDLSVLVPKDVLEEEKKTKVNNYKKNLSKGPNGKSLNKTQNGYRPNSYKPNQISQPQVNLDAEGNYRKLIYNRPKS